MIRSRPCNILLLHLRNCSIMWISSSRINIVRCAVVTLLAQLRSRVSAHLLESFGLAELTIDISVGNTHNIIAVCIVATSIRT